MRKEDAKKMADSEDFAMGVRSIRTELGMETSEEDITRAKDAFITAIEGHDHEKGGG